MRKPTACALLAGLSFLVLSSTGTPAHPVLLAGILGTEPYGCRALLVPPAHWYLLDGTGGFMDGDTVVVYAQDVDSETCDNHQTYEHLAESRLSAWRDFDFGCGIVTSDAEYGCEFFHSALYGVMSASGLSAYETGDSVHVFGLLSFPDGCLSFPECSAPTCFVPTHVEACDLSPLYNEITWGRVKATYYPEP